ncbi:hypothetical protein QEH59_14040 [Coraliomargarita sp. SDUM461004]|uniref:DUF7305 domain-containing protein n=1 Tax=Thalassobacterium sedimentorum TaxID=3041258 RepID=A0ABU1AL60_9BACT|nr:collagen-binding domain-containing protein [Coraliomargarita sp. SDUM461004]MDQ8195549.1 hypothetical protein [Coraliomargarita sp. SDUM461004]
MRTHVTHFTGSQHTTGSALIIALIFTTILGVIAVPSYLQLCSQTYKSSNRAFYNMATMNLAESGVEYAVNAIMSSNENPNYSWADWTIQGSDAQIQLSDHIFIGNITGATNIYIYNYASDAPEVVAKATVVLPSSPPITRYMYARVSASTSQGLFAYGMLTKDFIKASGGVVFDSWNSDPDNDSSTSFIPYSNSVATDKVAIATTGTSDGSITLGSSDVYGTAAIGGSDYSGLYVSWGGQVGPKDINEWDPSDTEELWKKNGWLVSTQTGALSTSFTADFETITAPTLELTHLWSEYKLPYSYDDPATSWNDNKYIDEETIGQQGIATVLNMNELEIKAGATLRIEGDVTINLPNENETTLKVIQGGAIEMASDATLKIYIAGNMEVTGAGIFSEVAPKQLQIWGTGTDTQSINFLNNGQFSGLIYAPNAEVKITGDSDLYGSIVCKNITLTGSGSFRYDQALANYTGDTSTPGPTRVDYVEELVGDERDPYVENLAF